MSRPPVIYLDTQDFSRFGDVLRGKSDPATEALFTQLEKRRQAGNAIFAVSMPILGELLQYDAQFRETTFRKAEAVERLCGEWALAFPTRLVAWEVAREANRRGLVAAPIKGSTLSPERYWYPNIADVFGNVRGQILEMLDAEIAGRGLPRSVRRGLAKKARKLDYASAARESAPQMAAEYGLPAEAITESLVALLRGKVSPEQASRRLFSAIAEPVKFVETYFEKVETDRSLLPAWIRSAGESFETSLAKLRSSFQPFVESDYARSTFDRLIADWPEKLGRTVLGLAKGDTAEFGVGDSLFASLSADESFSPSIPACEIGGKMLTAYARQVIGLTGPQAKIERSFGGDLVHALYLPHVDLWRGDRRFSALLKDTLPAFANRIVPTPKELPGAIDRWPGPTA